MGQPRGYASNSASPEAIEVYSQKIPPAPAMPRIATPFGGFNRQAYAAPVQRQPQAMYSPSMHLSMNGQSMHGQSMNGQGMNAPAMQPMQQPMYRQSAVATAPPSRPFPPLPTQVVTAGSSAKEVHRAPWFCLGLAVGVVSMVVAFFMPTSHAEPVASSPLPTMQIAPTQQQAAQAPTAMQPPTMVQPPMQQQMQPMQPMQAQPPAQAIAPAPLPPATQAVAPMQPAPSIASSQKQLPTVDVRSLPVAGAKAQAPAPRRPQYAARPQAPRRPAAQPPKPLPQDDDDALAERAPAPAPAPKAAPAQQQAQDTNALAADTLLQAL
jgi:hypothetical protein